METKIWKIPFAPPQQMNHVYRFFMKPLNVFYRIHVILRSVNKRDNFWTRRAKHATL